MEEGTIIIIEKKNKKGFFAKVSFTKKNGKLGELPITALKVTDDSYNGTKCKFVRERGMVIKLFTLDGTPLFDLTDQQATNHPKAKQKPQRREFRGHQQRPDSVRIADSFAPAHTFLPKDTQEALSSYRNPDNFSLKLDKAARFDQRMGKFQFYKRDRRDENYEIKANFGEIDFNQLAERELTNAKGLLSANQVHSIDLKLDGRMVHGLGIESVYETSLTLHQTYGIPYIPASSIKGLVRSWIISEVFGLPERAGAQKDFPLLNAEFRALSQSELFCKLFGCPSEVQARTFEDGKPVFKKDKKGKETSVYEKDKAIPVALKDDEGQSYANRGDLIFFDAYPLHTPVIEFEVMNPHYGPYYSDKDAKTPPADYHNPIPIHFITVAQTSFRFIVGSRNQESLIQLLGNKTIFEHLQQALQNHGIGAKTAVGYGYMKKQT